LLLRRHAWLVTVLGLCLLGSTRSSAGDDRASKLKLSLPAEPATCGKFGTSVEFVATPSEAARQARHDEKLVFVLHVSGHFEDPRFT
jgi:hypothetical protein